MLNPLALNPKQYKLWGEIYRLPTMNELAWKEQSRANALARGQARRWRMMRWMMLTSAVIALRLILLRTPHYTR